jgi:hypothetical protein
MAMGNPMFGMRRVCWIQDNSSTSTRQKSSATEFPQSAVWYITLRENQLWTVPYTTLERLQPEDKFLRLYYPRCVQDKTVKVPKFLCLVLRTDPAVRTRNAVHNLHNLHVRATESAHATGHSSSQQLFRVNVRDGSVDNGCDTSQQLSGQVDWAWMPDRLASTFFRSEPLEFIWGGAWRKTLCDGNLKSQHRN